jgi:hypothetical protein
LDFSRSPGLWLGLVGVSPPVFSHIARLSRDLIRKTEIKMPPAWLF